MDRYTALADGWPRIEGSDRLIVVVGASGSGKTEVIQAWTSLQFPASPVLVVRRVTTRVATSHPPFQELVSVSEFHALATRQALAILWHAHGQSYGVRAEALAPLASGTWMVLSGSRVHLPTLRQQAPDLLVVEVTSSPALRASRLAESLSLDDAELLKQRDRHTPDTKADLTLVNDGRSPATALQLQRWWLHRRGQARR